jgi:hypothetical protein
MINTYKLGYWVSIVNIEICNKNNNNKINTYYKLVY